MSKIMINWVDGEIMASKSYLKKARSMGSEEYKELKRIQNLYPEYKIVERQIKTNSNKKIYAGLTYEYMERYISLQENSRDNMDEYLKIKLLSECHRGGYGKVKKWFLTKFPEVAEFATDEFFDSIECETKVA